MESQEGKGLPPAAGEPSRKILAAIIAGIVICGALVGYIVYTDWSSPKVENLRAVAAGDVVTMDYIGWTPNQRVFDTSIYGVASNNALYPKSLTFGLRDNASYKPFNMTAGNYGSGGTIKGFALGVIGLRQGDHVTIQVQPGEGYAVNANLTKWMNLVEDIPLIEVMSDQDFRTDFKTNPVPMAILPHFFWGWDVQVLSILTGYVTIKHLPTVGAIYYPFGDPNDSTDPSGWPVEVLSSSAIDQNVTIRHHLSAGDVYDVKGTDIDGKTLIVTGYNGDNGTFQVGKNDPSVGYNAEIAGRLLLFEVTIIKVTPP